MEKKIFNKILLVALSAGIVLSILIFNKLTEPTPKLTKSARASLKISSTELLAQFLENEEMANETYVEKVIEVEGIVKEVTFLNNRYTVLLQGQGDYACLICDMNDNPTNQFDSITKGDTITLKGVCKGFLMDAILLNCVLITTQK